MDYQLFVEMYKDHHHLNHRHVDVPQLLEMWRQDRIVLEGAGITYDELLTLIETNTLRQFCNSRDASETTNSGQ